jgi:hypothetical protein
LSWLTEVAGAYRRSAAEEEGKPETVFVESTSFQNVSGAASGKKKVMN